MGKIRVYKIYTKVMNYLPGSLKHLYSSINVNLFITRHTMQLRFDVNMEETSGSIFPLFNSYVT